MSLLRATRSMRSSPENVEHKTCFAASRLGVGRMDSRDEATG